MKTEKKTVYVSDDKVSDKDGKQIYNFPSTVTHKDGKYILPVTYIDAEGSDWNLSEEYEAALADAGMDEQAITDAINAGVRLALGDLAKEPFRVSGNGVKTQAAALSWACQPANMAHFETWQNTVKTSGKAKADEALLAAYHASK